VVFGIFPQLLMGMVNSGVEPILPSLVELHTAPSMLGGVFK